MADNLSDGSDTEAEDSRDEKNSDEDSPPHVDQGSFSKRHV